MKTNCQWLSFSILFLWNTFLRNCRKVNYKLSQNFKYVYRNYFIFTLNIPRIQLKINTCIPYSTLFVLCWKPDRRFVSAMRCKKGQCDKCARLFVGINWILRAFYVRGLDIFQCKLINISCTCMYMSEDLQMIKRNSIGKRYDSNFLLHWIVVIQTVFQIRISKEKTRVPWRRGILCWPVTFAMCFLSESGKGKNHRQFGD